jgi:hypothetical protein
MTIFEDKPDVNNNQTESKQTEDDGLSAVNMSNWSSKNKRVAPRYVRDDIVVVLCETTHLSFGKEFFIDFVKLNDLSSRGLSFSSSHHIAVNKKIVLNLRFNTTVTFKIPASIIYRINTSPYQYGVKFDNDNQELSDHLLETQSKLVFK